MWTKKSSLKGRRRAPPTNQIDWMTEDNAIILANHIERYWAERGYFIKSYIREFAPGAYRVQSDMVNGRPR